MYATATLVLPLGSIFFASPIMGVHAQTFQWLTVTGLVVILLGTCYIHVNPLLVPGIAIYVGVDWWWRKRKHESFFEKKVSYWNGEVN